MNARLLFLGLASAAVAFGQYAYNYSGGVSSYDMTQNGTVDSWSPVAQFYTGGSLIWSPTVTGGANSNDYEVNTTVALAPGGGTYVHYLRATSNARLYPGGCTGSFIAVALAVPGTYASGGAAGAMYFYQCTAGSLWWFASTGASVLNGSTLRTVVFGTTLWVFIDNQMAASVGVPATTGQPGVGGYGMTSSSGFSQLSIGPRDTVAPSAVVATGVRSSILPNQGSLAWQGALDNVSSPPGQVNGIGVFGYNLFRNGVYLQLCATAAFTDTTLAPGTSYTYALESMDFHGNASAMTSFTVTTPPATSVDPRRVGVFTTGSYWGGGGEQIDMLSGNLNFSMPLVSPQWRTGASIPLGLSYNSQNWRQDSGTNWELGADVGYGFGWMVQFGSITPYYMAWPWGVDHYVFTDGTGAQYRLDQNSGNVWSSQQGIYVWFDANTDTLHFKNGSFWLMGDVSSGAEQDAGTMYPTVLEDVGGNQITVSYNGGAGLPSGSVNTSARINFIQDVRGGATSYHFSWATSGPSAGHLANVYQYFTGIPTTYFSFNYTPGATLGPPFGSDPAYSGLTTTQISSIDVPVAGSYAFTYDSTGASELLQAQFPWGGHLRWTYDTATYAGGRLLREINNRYMYSSATSGGTEYGPYPITHSDSGVSGGIPIVHADTTLADASGVGAKKWTFNNSSSTAWLIGLVSEFDQMATATSTSKLTTDTYTWMQTPTSANPYISMKLSVKDPGTGSAASALTNQTLDQYGNATQVVVYPYNNPTTPAATYNSTYVTSPGYISAYLRGLLASSTITVGSTVTTLVTNTYDGCYSYGYPTPPSYNFDPGAISTLPTRGYLSSSVTPAGTSSACYYWYGVPYSTTSVNGTTTVSSVSSITDYTMPDTIMTPTYSNALTYDSWLSLTSTTGLNGETMSLTYDSLGRPATGTSPYGAVTTYGYTAAGVLPVQQTSTGPNGFSQTTLDGFGRAVLAQSGPSYSSIQSQTSTVYAPCACSPLGKIQAVSQPYAPGATEYWTSYAYDGIGRTLTTTLPDAASTTVYSYAGNTTKVTDPTGKWKTFTSDVLGNLTTVLEPNPAGGTFTTSYTYDWMNHLIGSSMARGTTTQTRTFVYNNAGQLTSATNPESGTVAYTYNTDTTLNTKTDAKGQVTVYSYDISKRVTETQVYPYGLTGGEDVCQRVTYVYGAGTNGLGRLTSTAYGLPNPGSGSPIYGSCTGMANGYAYQEAYTYDAPGQVTNKTFTLTTNDPAWGGWPTSASIGINYTYDSVGRLSTAAYPYTVPYGSPAPTYTYAYDGMGRPVSMTDGGGTPWVQNGQYDPAGHMTSMTVSDGGSYFWDSRTKTASYNHNGQLTGLNWAYTTYPTFYPSNIQYTYSTTANNGQITQMTDISGETVSYAYDALKRLTGATSVSGGTTAWTQTYGYDGFGNMTLKTLNGGANSAPAVDPTTNRLTSGYDANGNMLTGYGLTMTYDERNRVASASQMSGTEYYGYAPDNKRIYRWNPTTGTEEWTFYGVRGERVGSFGLNTSATYYFHATQTNLWFAGQLISNANGFVFRDRLGTDRETSAEYYPYGDEITSTANGTEKYGTYFRDSFTALDYADQRYYASSYGRFNTADQYRASASAKDPGTWNKYVYVGGDPINRADPTGQYFFSCFDACGGSGGGGGGGYCGGFGPTSFGPGDGGEGGGEEGGEGEFRAFAAPVCGPYKVTPPPFPECSSTSGNTVQNNNLQFLVNNWASAVTLGTQYDIPPDWILGWAALESSSTSTQGNWYGNLPQALAGDNNFLGETATGWAGQTSCATTVTNSQGSTFACFSSFFDSVNAALAKSYGGILTADALAGYTPAAAFTDVYNAGWNRKTADASGALIGSTITKHIDPMLNCLMANGYI